MRKLAFLLACAVALLPGAALASTPQEGTSVDPILHVPAGFRVTAKRTLAPGLLQATLVRRTPPAVVNVAVRAPGSPAEMRVILSNDAVAGEEPRLERTSSMCARTQCLVAVNGDFFTNATSEPVGAIVAGDQLLRSPNPKHIQLSESADGTLSTGQLTWRGTLVPSDLQQIALDGVNVSRDRGELVLYTPAQGRTTGANRFGAELVLQVVGPEGAIRVGRTTLVSLVELRHAGDTPIPADGAVLSGHGRGHQAIQDLWNRVQAGKADPEALLRLDVTPDVVESIGAAPILVRDGKRWFADEPRDLYRLRAPRTLAGWTAGGQLLLVTVDGRQSGYSLGITMAEAAELMIGLGAVEAVNLDGGGSTAFIVGGSVINRPSDRAVRRGGKTVVVSQPRATDKIVGNIERPVAVAVALVGPRVQSQVASGAMPRSLVATLGSGGGSPAVVLSGAAGPDTSVLLLVLLAVGTAVVSAQRRRGAVTLTRI